MVETRKVHGPQDERPYDRYGTGDELILFIHGGVGGLSTYITGKLHPHKFNSVESLHPAYYSLLLALSKYDKFSVITYDRRNCGKAFACSEKWYSLDDLALDAIEIMDRVSAGCRFHVVGTSAGGPIALRLVRRYSFRTRSLVLLNTAADMLEANPSMEIFHKKVLPHLTNLQKERTYFEKKQLHAHLIKKLLKDIDENEFSPEEESISRAEFLNAIKALSEDTVFRVWKGTNRNLYVYKERQKCKGDASNVKIPTFIIHGKKDSVIPIYFGKELHRLIPHSDFQCIDDGVHGIARDKRSHALICSWLETIDQCSL